MDVSEEMVGEVIVPADKKLEDLIRLSELCVDLLRQNEEFYAEVSSAFADIAPTSENESLYHFVCWDG